MVREGRLLSRVTVWSVLGGGSSPFPAASWAPPAAIAATTEPSVMPLTATLYVVGPPVTATLLVPPAVPLMVTLAAVKSVTASLKTTVKLIGDAPVGSA